LTAIATEEKKEHVVCSFCGKSRHDVAKLIAGPGVYICNECVGLCDQILDDSLHPEFTDWSQSGDDELLAKMVAIHESHAQVDRAVSEMVKRLRERGVSWGRIGEALDMTRQSAWERFSGEE
jgi:hypothetical protein